MSQRVPTIHEVSRATGMGMGEIRGGMEQAGTDDPVIGAGYAAASGFAVKIKGLRHEYNLGYAESMAPRIRELVDQHRGMRATDG